MHSNSKHPAGSVTCTTKITEPWNDSDYSQFLLLILQHSFVFSSELTVSKVQNKAGERKEADKYVKNILTHLSASFPLV